MSWVRTDDAAPDHPKLVGLDDTAIAMWWRGLCYASRYRTDGAIPRGALARLTRDRKPETVAARLTAAGLWEATKGGYTVHDFLEYNLSAAEQEERARARAEAGRRGGQRSGESRRGKGEADGNQPGSKREASASQKPKQREAKPNPDPDPPPDPRSDLQIQPEARVSRAQAPERARAEGPGGGHEDAVQHPGSVPNLGESPGSGVVTKTPSLGPSAPDLHVAHRQDPATGAARLYVAGLDAEGQDLIALAAILRDEGSALGISVCDRAAQGRRPTDGQLRVLRRIRDERAQARTAPPSRAGPRSGAVGTAMQGTGGWRPASETRSGG